MRDLEMMSKRDEELSKINHTTSYTFAGVTCFLFITNFILTWRTPYFSQVLWYLAFGSSGFFLGGLIVEKIAAELYYNKILLDMADKYNFSPSEVVELQWNLNEYYIWRDKEEDLKSIQ